jgi:hypothetical protein
MGLNLLYVDATGNVPVRSVHQYFTSHAQLKVPAWQRDYSWEASDEGQVGVLLDDLSAYAANDALTEYLLGSVILCDNDEGMDQSWLIIDGQQRSMTLSLFLLCSIKYVQMNNLLNGASHTELTTFTSVLSCVNANADNQLPVFAPRLAMNNKDADDVIKNVWAWTQMAGEESPVAVNAAPKTQTERNIREVAEYIFKRLASDELFKRENFLKALTKIIQSIKLVELTLDSRKEALSVYDRINNRGLVLSSADLVKNQIFMNVPDAEFDDVSDSWLDMARELNSTGKARLQDPKFLLRIMASTRKGEKITYDDLVDYWADKINSQSGEIKATEFAEDLTRNAGILKRLATAQTVRESSGLGPALVVDDLYLPHELGSVQHYAMLLAGKHFTDPETQILLGKQIAHRALLYIFARERTGQFESIIPTWANEISLLPADATPDELASLYRLHAFHKDVPRELVVENLHSAIAAWDYKNSSDKKKIRCAFALLNKDLSTDFSAKELMRTRKKAEERKGWDIDHIMPRTKSNEEYVHHIGNLTLLAPNENSGAGASLPLEKAEKNVYLQSPVYLTKILSPLELLTPLQRGQIEGVLQKRGVQINYSLSSWGVEAANNRAKFLAEWIEHVLVGQYT